jgi:tetratricopeptide (TPR) repeat protein
MHKSVLISAMLLSSAVGWTQTAPPPAQAPAQGTSTPAPTNSQGLPAPAATNPQSPPAASTPAPHRVLQAKSQEELKAYDDAKAKTDPAQAEATANEFAAKYPDSELRATLYVRAMTLYAQSNNSDKVIATGRQAITADPTNPIPLVQVAAALAEGTRDTDLDREQRLTEAAKDAHAAIDNIDTGLLVSSDADPARVAAAKTSILTMAYDTLGSVDMSRNDYAAAVTNLQKAIEQSKGNPEAVLYLRLSVAQDKLKQYQPALDSANKAVQYAQPGSAAQNLAKQQQDRLQKLIASGPAGASAAPSAAPSPTPPPAATSSPAPAVPTNAAPPPGATSTPH